MFCQHGWSTGQNTQRIALSNVCTYSVVCVNASGMTCTVVCLIYCLAVVWWHEGLYMMYYLLSMHSYFCLITMCTLWYGLPVNLDSLECCVYIGSQDVRTSGRDLGTNDGQLGGDVYGSWQTRCFVGMLEAQHCTGQNTQRIALDNVCTYSVVCVNASGMMCTVVCLIYCLAVVWWYDGSCMMLYYLLKLHT